MCYEIGMKGAVVVVLASLAMAPIAAGAKPVAHGYIDKPAGFKIILPPKWYAVPRPVKQVQAAVAAAKKAKKTGLASEFSFYLTAAGKQQLKDYAFQAFLDVSPSTDPLIPQLSIQVAATKGATLKAAATAYANALAGIKGAKIYTPKKIKLAAGAAEYIPGTVPRGSGLSDGVALYLLVHGGKVYVLKFDIDAAAFNATSAKAFAQIAETFGWV